ncbi:unnamed protein product [Amoebophrya sp. A120]|nr:unnamed protein product [Amoebophrya sp. A120]|eukprot:GSA120T00023564001.1
MFRAYLDNFLSDVFMTTATTGGGFSKGLSSGGAAARTSSVENFAGETTSTARHRRRPSPGRGLFATTNFNLLPTSWSTWEMNNTGRTPPAVSCSSRGLPREPQEVHEDHSTTGRGMSAISSCCGVNYLRTSRLHQGRHDLLQRRTRATSFSFADNKIQRRTRATSFSFADNKIPKNKEEMEYMKMTNKLKGRKVLKYKMRMNMNLDLPDKKFADADPICQSLGNCPDRGLFSGVPPNGFSGDTGDDDLDEHPGFAPAPEDEVLDVGGSLMPCDGWGRIEQAGKFPYMGEYCDDPHRRGYNICVSVLPADFSKRTGGFCYSSSLNHAASSAWFGEKNHKWERRAAWPKRADPSKHRDVQVGVADMYECRDVKGQYWPVTLLQERVDHNGTYEALVFDHNLTPLGVSEVDAGFIRSYGGKDFDAPDRVVLSSIGAATAYGRSYGLQPTESGTIVGGSLGRWVVKSDVTGQQYNYTSMELQHAGRNFDRLVGPKTYLQVDSEYIWRREKKDDSSSFLGHALSTVGGLFDGADEKHEALPVVLKSIDPDGQHVKLEVFDPDNKDWSTAEHVPKNELMLLPGLDTGRTFDICRSHIAHPYCITGPALHRYMHGSPTNNAHAAIEVNCLGTSDRRTMKEHGFGGSNCARYMRTQKGFNHFRLGLDDTWRDDGNIKWTNVVNAHPISGESFLS